MKLLAGFLFSLLSLTAFAQVFPLQVTTQLVPPYSPYLSDYAAPGARSLMVQIRSNDLTLSAYPFRLRITIEGRGITLRTRAAFVPRQLILEGGGIPQTFYGEDLYEYFHVNAMDFSGLSRSDHQTTRLPEGVYRFTVEVLDYHRGTVVSNPGVATAWIILNDPPLLNSPANQAKLTVQDPLNILFSWTPRHAGSPNAAFTTEYTFRLTEIWPEHRNPYDAVLTQAPLYETTTTQNQILYGLNEPALIPGRRYAWQVEARDTEGRDLFKHNGRSEVFVFRFGEALPMPENFKLRWAKPATLSMRWDAVMGNTEEVRYRLQYRPRLRRENHQWYETTTRFTEKTLYHLEPNTEYEMRLRSETPVQESAYTETRIFRTLREVKEEFVCKDIIVPPPAPANTLPLFPLSVNDTLHVGGFDVLVRDVIKVDKKYSGSGLAIVPWLNGAKVRVTFENISVNDRFWLTGGTVHSVWSAESKFLLQHETPLRPGDAPEAGELDITIVSADSLITIENSAIVAVTVDDHGQVIVHTSDGAKQTLRQGESYAIKDQAGNGYIVDRQGNVAKTTATEAVAAAARGERNYDLKFSFSRGEGRFGFDEQKHDALSLYYQQVDNGKAVAWKALPSFGSDVVAGTLESEEIDIKAIQFQTGVTSITPVPKDLRTVSLTVPGRLAGTEEELLALHHPADSTPHRILGKLNLVTYDPIHYFLQIVSVNGASLPGGVTTETLSRELNRIYDQAVVSWKLNTPGDVQVNLPDRFDEGETGLFSNYTDDMKKVIRAWGPLEDNTYYLFLIDAPNDPNTLGYMPRNKQAGFVFVEPHQGNATEFIKTIAHELGHGAFNLKHTFSEYDLPGGATDNLMDYSSGTALYKYQWDHIHEPAAVINLFDGEEDAASVVVTNLAQLKPFANPDGSYTFLAPTGVPFTLPATTQSVKFWTNDVYPDEVISMDECPDGALIAFTIDNQIFRYHKREGETKGTGYKVVKGDIPYIDYLSKKQIGLDEAIIGLPCAEGGQLKFIARKVRFHSALPTENSSAEGTLALQLPIEDPYDLEYSTRRIDLEAALDFTYTEEALAFIADNQACFNEMVQYVIKAADVIQRNPGHYTRYKSCHPYPIKYPEDGETETEKAWLLGQYYEKLKGFADELLDYVQQSEYARENVLSVSDPDALGQLLKAGCESDFSLFTFAQREHILNVLSKGNLQDYWLGLGNARENIVVYTLRQTPPEQYEQMLSLLARDHYALLKTLILKTDNQLVGQDNFDRLIDAVTVMIQKSVVYEQLEHDILHDRLVRWGSAAGFSDFRYDCSGWVEDSGQEKIVFRSSNVAVDFTGTGEVTGVHFTTTETPFSPLEVSPFDFVALRLYNDVVLSNGNPILRRAVGELQALPAIYLYWMIQRKATDETLSRIRANVNILLFAIGGAEIVAARTGLRLALAITDQTLFATSFMLEAGPRRMLEEGPNGAEWASVFKAFDAFNLLYGATRIGQGLSWAAQDVLAQRDLLLRLRETEDWSRFSPAQANILKEYLMKAEKGMDELDGVVGSLGAKGDELTEVMGATRAGEHLLDLPAPVGKFRQLVSRTNKTYRAADFWKQNHVGFKMFHSGDGKYLIKHDPATGRMLFVDLEEKAFIGFALDEENLIANDYVKLLQNLKTVHGLPGGVRSLTIRGKTIHFAADKPNFLLGKYKPNQVPGITDEIGTDDIINELSILKNYSFADEAFVLRPGSVHVLNIPDGMPIRPGLAFFDTYNREFLDLIVKNKTTVNLIFVSDPRNANLLRLFRNGVVKTNYPTGFGKEIKYLREQGVDVGQLLDGSQVRLHDIELNGLDWTDWKY